MQAAISSRHIVLLKLNIPKYMHAYKYSKYRDVVDYFVTIYVTSIVTFLT